MSSRTKPLRVLTLIDQIIDSGGAERYAVGLAASLPRDRVESWVCTTRRSEGLLVKSLAECGVPHIDLSRRTRWDVYRLSGLVSLLRRERFDVLHAHMFGSNLWGALLGRACGVPVVVAHEHGWPFEGNMRRLLDGLVIGRLASRFVAVSAVDAARMVGHERVPANKVVTIPTAHVPRDPSTYGDLRSELGLSDETPLIGVAAVLRPEKALEVLLEACALLRERMPHAQLVIAGSGPSLDGLVTRTHELGLSDAVHFLGHRDDIDAILRAVDVAALSSDSEGAPLFAYECMANGTPLVCTAVGGLPDIVLDGRTGLLVPRRDPVALATALTDLLLDPERRGRLAAAAAARLPEFTIDAAGEHFADLYESLVAGARR